MFDDSTVLTPHGGEFQAMSGKTPSKDLKVRADEVKGVCCKQWRGYSHEGTCGRYIRWGSVVRLNDTGNPGMTVGGTGDVLSGIIGGLMAQGIGAFRAAVAGAFINGAAGDLAEEQLGYHLTPSDLLDYIPKVLNDPMCHKEIHQKRLQ